MRTVCSGVAATIFLLIGLSFLSVALCGEATPAEPTPRVDIELLVHGRYLTKIAGCNDCHTPGYSMSEGRVPESRWLLGDESGQRGPRGTAYGPNLRLRLNQMTEDQWLDLARTGKGSSPMPWYNLGSMTGDDLRAIYRFVRSLGRAAEPAPGHAPSDPGPIR